MAGPFGWSPTPASAPVGGMYFGTPAAAVPAYAPAGGQFFGTPLAQATQFPGLNAILDDIALQGATAAPFSRVPPAVIGSRRGLPTLVGNAPKIKGLTAAQRAALMVMNDNPSVNLLAEAGSGASATGRGSRAAAAGSRSATAAARQAAARVAAYQAAVGSQGAAPIVAGTTPAATVVPGATSAVAGATPAATSVAAQAAAQAAAGGAHPFAGLAGASPGAAGGLAARLGAGNAAPTWLTQRLAGQSTAGLGLRSIAKGSLGRAGLWGAAGQLGGMAVEGTLGAREGTWDDTLRNAAVGAGIGAGIGSVVPVVGTGVGAAIGGVAGGLHGFLTGRDSKETEANRAIENQTERFNEQFAAYNVSPQTRDQFLMQFALATDGMGRKDINATADEMRSILPSLIMEDDAMQQQERGRAAMFAAAQSWMAPMMQQAMSRSTTAADQLMESALISAEQIPNATRRAFAIEDARRIPLDTATNQAYAMQQLMSLPGLYGYSTGQSGVPTDIGTILGAQPIGGGAGGMMPMPMPSVFDGNVSGVSSMFPQQQQQPRY